MGQFSTQFRRPPVRIGLAAAAQQQGTMLSDTPRTAMGAGGYGSREARNRSVDMALRIDLQGPTRAGALPIGTTRRKRGYPSLPQALANAGVTNG
jgi:hypothetical protein